MIKLNQLNRIVLIALLVFSPLAISFVIPTKAEAASLIGHETNGVPIWQISGGLVTIPIGSYGSISTDPLISLRISNNATVKILGPHTFYNLTVDSGSTVTSDALVAGEDYSIIAGETVEVFALDDVPANIDNVNHGVYTLRPSAQNKKIDLSIQNKLQVNGTITADGLGFAGGNIPTIGLVQRGMFGYHIITSPGFAHGHGPGGGAARIATQNDHSSGAGGGFGGKGGAGFACDDGGCTPLQTEVPAGMPAAGVTYGAAGDFGSGGGYANHDLLNEPASGGAGGGVIKIQAKEISMSDTSKISADGLPGIGGTETAGGAGSGGSVSILFDQGSIKQPYANAGVNVDNWQAWRAGNGQVSIVDVGSKVSGGTNNITANGGIGVWRSGAGGGGRILVGALTLVGSLSVTPTSGVAPLATTLTATASGTESGTLNYTFWWNCESTSNNVSEVRAAEVCGNPADSNIGAKFDGVGSDILTKSVSHNYGTAGTKYPKVIIERGAATPVSASATVVATAPSLTAAIAAAPSSGNVPLTTTLTASRTGAAAGTINYTFWWNCSNQSNSVGDTISVCGDPADSAVGVKFNNLAADITSKAVSHTYSSVLSYQPKIIIEQGAAVPSAKTAIVNVQNPPCAPLADQTRTISCPAGQTGIISQIRRSTCPGPTWGEWTTITNTCVVRPPSTSSNINFIQDTRPESAWPPGFRDLTPLSSKSK